MDLRHLKKSTVQKDAQLLSRLQQSLANGDYHACMHDFYSLGSRLKDGHKDYVRNNQSTVPSDSSKEQGDSRTEQVLTCKQYVKQYVIAHLQEYNPLSVTSSSCVRQPQKLTTTLLDASTNLFIFSQAWADKNLGDNLSKKNDDSSETDSSGSVDGTRTSEVSSSTSGTSTENGASFDAESGPFVVKRTALRESVSHKKDISKKDKLAIRRGIFAAWLGIISHTRTLIQNKLKYLETQLNTIQPDDSDSGDAGSATQVQQRAQVLMLQMREHLREIDDMINDPDLQTEKAKTKIILNYTMHCRQMLLNLNSVEQGVALESSIDKAEITRKYNQAVAAINGFGTVWAWFLWVIGVMCGVLSGIACGSTTGLSVTFFLLPLLAPLGPVGIALAVFVGVCIGLAGFYSNTRYFSKNLPQILAKFYSKVTYCIGEDGKYKSLSRIQRFFVGVAFLASLCVGLSTGIMIVHVILGFLPLILPASLMLPYVLIPILALLAIPVCVAITLVMFNAFLSIVHNPQHYILLIKNYFSNLLQNFTPLTVIACVLKVAVLAVVIFALYQLCFIGCPDLATALSFLNSAAANIVSYITCALSFIGQLPFTIATTLSLWDRVAGLMQQACNRLIGLFCSNNNTPLSSTSWTIRDIVSGVASQFLILLNAFGNSALQLQNGISPGTIPAATGGLIISVAANQVGDLSNEQCRTEANATDCKQLYSVLGSNTHSNDQMHRGNHAVQSETTPQRICGSVDHGKKNNYGLFRRRASVGGTCLKPVDQCSDFPDLQQQRSPLLCATSY